MFWILCSGGGCGEADRKQHNVSNMKFMEIMRMIMRSVIASPQEGEQQ